MLSGIESVVRLVGGLATHGRHGSSSASSRKEERGDGERYLRLEARYLAWWNPALEGMNLAAMTEEKLREIVEQHEPRDDHHRHHRLTSIRAFVNWTC